jgi:hypothetical protein
MPLNVNVSYQWYLDTEDRSGDAGGCSGSHLTARWPCFDARIQVRAIRAPQSGGLSR